MGSIADAPLDDLLSPRPVLQASLFCLSTHSDVEGNLTLISTFHSLPRGRAPEFMLVNLWRHDLAERRQVREWLTLRDPDGQVLGELSAAPFALGGSVRYWFTLVRLTEVNFTVSGTHEVRIQLEDVETGKVTVSAATPLIVT